MGGGGRGVTVITHSILYPLPLNTFKSWQLRSFPHPFITIKKIEKENQKVFLAYLWLMQDLGISKHHYFFLKMN
jgi:hypothetical protein